MPNYRIRGFLETVGGGLIIEAYSYLSSCPQNGNRELGRILLPRTWNRFREDRAMLLEEIGGLDRCEVCGFNKIPENILAFEEVFTESYVPDIRASADQGCVLCAIQLRLLLKLGIDDRQKGWLYREGNSFFFLKEKIGFILRANIFQPLKKTEHSWAVVLEEVTEDPPIYDIQYPPPVGFPRQSPLSGSTFGESTRHWAMKQIQTCELHHNCRESTGKFIPTRLLSLDGNSVSLKTRSDVNSEARYVALSYCWGKIVPACLTTKATLLKNMEGIPWSELPQTFKDAIVVTRALGIDYLWIDSICIIQKDEEDWARESSQMYDVYKNAYVTLAGVHAYDSSQGLFSSPDRIPFRELCQVRLGIKGYYHTLKFDPQSPQFYDWAEGNLPVHAPLFTRAWCYQERLVSPRVLYFTPQELVWECNEIATCVCQPTNPRDGLPFNKNLTCPKSSYSHTLRSAIIAIQRSHFPSDELIPLWHDIITNFSTLGTTNEADRLPAIGAIAQSLLPSRPADEYCAGLWLSTLLDDLTWYSTDPSAPRSPAFASNDAPSWSWASLQRPVRFFRTGEDGYMRVKSKEIYSRDNALGSPFGMCYNARLHLKGWSLPGYLSMATEAQSSKPIYQLGNLPGGLLSPQSDDIYPDFAVLSSGQSVDVSLLFICEILGGLGTDAVPKRPNPGLLNPFSAFEDMPFMSCIILRRSEKPTPRFVVTSEADALQLWERIGIVKFTTGFRTEIDRVFGVALEGEFTIV